jgi:hypothetical protein
MEENSMIRVCETAKVKKRLLACKEVGMKITENPITVTTVAVYKDDTVISCQRKGPNKWEVKYNLKYWEEVDIMSDGAPPADEMPDKTTAIERPKKNIETVVLKDGDLDDIRKPTASPSIKKPTAKKTLKSSKPSLPKLPARKNPKKTPAGQKPTETKAKLNIKKS